jgi:hypothetical protein
MKTEAEQGDLFDKAKRAMQQDTVFTGRNNGSKNRFVAIVQPIAMIVKKVNKGDGAKLAKDLWEKVHECPLLPELGGGSVKDKFQMWTSPMSDFSDTNRIGLLKFVLPSALFSFLESKGFAFGAEGEGASKPKKKKARR